jgi:hypothetical protein
MVYFVMVMAESRVQHATYLIDYNGNGLFVYIPIQCIVTLSISLRRFWSLECCNKYIFSKDSDTYLVR